MPFRCCFGAARPTSPNNRQSVGHERRQQCANVKMTTHLLLFPNIFHGFGHGRRPLQHGGKCPVGLPAQRLGRLELHHLRINKHTVDCSGNPGNLGESPEVGKQYGVSPPNCPDKPYCISLRKISSKESNKVPFTYAQGDPMDAPAPPTAPKTS